MWWLVIYIYNWNGTVDDFFFFFFLNYLIHLNI